MISGGRCYNSNVQTFCHINPANYYVHNHNVCVSTICMTLVTSTPNCGAQYYESAAECQVSGLW